MNIVAKLAFMALGLTSTAIGIVGVWLPGLPTTIFILIALWAFSKSSQRLHSWLQRIPLLKSALEDTNRFQQEGTVARRAKIVSQACAWTSFIFVTVVLQSWTVSVVVGLLALSCTVFMLWVPTTQNRPIPLAASETPDSLAS